jgi:hypothetical protein
MSRGTKLQEMEQSKTAVNANAAKAILHYLRKDQ